VASKAPTAPILPSRYEEVLNQRVAEQAGKMVASAQAARPALELPRWGAPVAVIGVGAMGVMMLLAQQDGPSQSRVGFDKSTVISTGTVGVQASAEELIPPRPARPPSPEAPALVPPDPHLHEPAATPTAPPVTEKPARRLSAAPRPTRSAQPCTTCGRTDGDESDAALAAAAGPSPQPTPSGPPKAALNVGTRFSAVLAYPVNTAFGGAPVTARVEQDIAPNGTIAIPAGATLIGEAFATEPENRAQIVFTAMVRDGRTLPFRAIALGPDSNLGIPGKVVRKASAKKKGAGRVLSAVGSAVTFGLIGGDNGVVGDAAAALASQTANDLSQLERTWSLERSDKVIALNAGIAMTVYVQSDLAAQ
jgi:type IV secretory pathway VirB10-like protein